MKPCCRCKMEKPLTEFHKCKTWPDGLHKRCKACNTELTKTTYKEKHAASGAAWRKKNPEKAKAINSRYCQKHAPRVLAHARARQAKIRNAIPEWAKTCPEEKAKVLALYQEAKVLTKQTSVKHHVDHIVPLAAGGLHVSTNLQILTATENLSKGSQHGGRHHNPRYERKS